MERNSVSRLPLDSRWQHPLQNVQPAGPLGRFWTCQPHNLMRQFLKIEVVTAIDIDTGEIERERDIDLDINDVGIHDIDEI